MRFKVGCFVKRIPNKYTDQWWTARFKHDPWGIKKVVALKYEYSQPVLIDDSGERVEPASETLEVVDFPEIETSIRKMKDGFISVSETSR